ncbi:MAG: hypothetical protein IPK08_16095 [Bacteroidetes bacterium]|nr:hypothetical protein [Bacteroidota bacterium]
MNDPQIAWTIPFAGQTNPTAQSVVVPGITDFNHGTWAIALETSPCLLSCYLLQLCLKK